MQQMFMYYDKRRFCHVSLNVIIIVSNIWTKHYIKCENVRTNKKGNIKTYYPMFQLSATVPYITPSA